MSFGNDHIGFSHNWMVSCGNSISINHINLFSHKTAKVQAIEASEFNRRSFCAFPDLRQLTASIYSASS